MPTGPPESPVSENSSPGGKSGVGSSALPPESPVPETPSPGGQSVAPKGLPATTAESVTDKLRRYLLDPNHPAGGPKAKWFKEALGFTQDNLDDLARQIKFDPMKAVQTAVTEHGTKFNQVIEIVGANEKKIDVTFAWIRNNDGTIRLVTSIPTPR